MFLRQIYHEELAQASYLIGCQATGEAIVVDPNRAIEHYLDLAAQAGLRITAVTETHIHADYVSGARELALRTGAQLYLSDMGTPEWKYGYATEAHAILLDAHDRFMVGNIEFQVLHTPGHTPEHLAFLVTDTAHTTVPIGLLSGDFLFVGDVGRPDLLERAAGIGGTMRAAAQQLFHSLEHARQLPEYLQIWPGHGAGSACGKALGAVPQSTIGYEKATSWAFEPHTEATFIEAVLTGQPDPPPYFARMKYLNKVGPMPRPTEPLLQLTLPQLQSTLSEEILIVDTRAAAEFAAGHIPGTLNIPAGGGLLNWAGWLIAGERPFGLIGTPAQIEAARAELLLIGLDQLVGYWVPSVVEDWRAAGFGLAHYQRQRAHLWQPAGAPTAGSVLLDVRSAAEYDAGHIPGSRNIVLGHLIEQLAILPRDQQIVVYCQGGSRSPIAASILQAYGWSQVRELSDGFAGWQAAGANVEQSSIAIV